MNSLIAIDVFLFTFIRFINLFSSNSLKKTKYFKNSKPFIVHRLDKETSGILIIAKNLKSSKQINKFFKDLGVVYITNIASFESK